MTTQFFTDLAIYSTDEVKQIGDMIVTPHYKYVVVFKQENLYKVLGARNFYILIRLNELKN